MSTLYTEATRALKKLNGRLQQVKDISKQLQQETLHKQQRLDEVMADKTQLHVQCTALQDTVATLEGKVATLEDTIETERHLYRIDKRVSTCLADISSAADQWVGVVDQLVGHTSDLGRLIDDKYVMTWLSCHVYIATREYRKIYVLHS